MRGTANDDDELWRRLDWNDVRTFLAVADSGSLNAAARALGMAQPTISRRMEDLEYRLGARLFSRSSRGISLTDTGEVVRDLAASMARYGGSIMREAAGRDRQDAGRVRIAAPDGLAGFVLMPALAAFQRANPEIQIALDCGLWPDSPLQGDTDLSLEFTESCPADVVSTPIATNHYAFFAARDYLDLYGEPQSLAEVAEHRLVHHIGIKEQMRTWHPKLSAVISLSSAHLISNSSASTFMAIINGVGVGLLPTYVLTIQPNLVMLDLGPMGHPVLFLRHHAAAERQGRIKRVKDWIMGLHDPVENPWYRDEFIHPRDFERASGRPHAARRASRRA